VLELLKAIALDEILKEPLMDWLDHRDTELFVELSPAVGVRNVDKSAYWCRTRGQDCKNGELCHHPLGLLLSFHIELLF
jgi:hypothetical protein